MASDPISSTGPTSLRPTGFAETILIITILFGIFCVVAVVLRTWQRIRDRNFHVDDAVTWLGLVSQHTPTSEDSHNNTDTRQIFNLLQYAAVAWGTTVGIGSPDSMLAEPMTNGLSQANYCKSPHTSATVAQRAKLRLPVVSQIPDFRLHTEFLISFQVTDMGESRDRGNVRLGDGLYQSQHLQHAAAIKQGDQPLEDYLGSVAHHDHSHGNVNWFLPILRHTLRAQYSMSRFRGYPARSHFSLGWPLHHR